MSDQNSVRIVLTGGPCAGKTTMVDIVSRTFAGKAVSVPESASLLFSGGFPRFQTPDCQRATQTAIYQVQLQLEASYAANYPNLALVLDRGTIDGAAYWPDGPEAFFACMGTTLEKELNRYSQVIYLSSAAEKEYQMHRLKNPNRRETWEEAARLDARTFELWARHPRFTHVQQFKTFSHKSSLVLAAIDGAIDEENHDEKK